MRVDAAPRIAFRECCDEQGRALRGFEGWWGAEVNSGFGVDLLGEGEDVDVFGFHEFFLHA